MLDQKLINGYFICNLFIYNTLGGTGIQRVVVWWKGRLDYFLIDLDALWFILCNWKTNTSSTNLGALWLIIKG